MMENEEEKGGDLNLRKLKLEIFEKENPAGVELLEQEIQAKMVSTKVEIMKLVDQKVEEYFQKRKVNRETPSYIG